MINIGEIDLAKFQDEVGIWSRRNFGDQPAYRPLLGMVEELGELYEADDASDFSAMLDSIGDLMVFMADFCHRRGLSLSEIVEAAEEPSVDFSESALMKAVGRVCHAQLKLEQGIRTDKDHVGDMKKALSQVVTALCMWADLIDSNVAQATLAAWSIVSKRNWAADPSKGAA